MQEPIRGGRSSTESEILALAFVLRAEGIPVLGRWQFLAENLRDKSGAEGPAGVRRIPIMMVFEDSTAVINITLNKRSMALRHLLRTRHAANDCIFEFFEGDDVVFLRYVNNP